MIRVLVILSCLRVLIGRFSEVLEKIASLEVGIWMHYGVQISLVPGAILFDFLDLSFVAPFEHSIASNVISRLLDVLLHAA